MYKEQNLPLVSYECYRKIFNSHFNIKFGYPHSSACDKYQADLIALQKELTQTSTSEIAQNEIKEQIKITEVVNEVHKRKAQVFYERKKTARKESMKHETHDAVAFDFKKNLSMPNLTTNDIYYRRQHSLYSFNIHILSTGYSVFYCYSETEGRKGSDEVTYFLHHFIFTILDPKVKHLELFCDGCAGQNKNYTIFRFLQYVVHATHRLDYIKITFPVRGHSYLECDRNMALINQKYPAEIPEHWVTVFENARIKPSPFNVCTFLTCINSFLKFDVTLKFLI